MTIKKHKGELVVECDEGCGKEEFAGTLEFREFVQQIKDDGWKIKKDGEAWLHTYPDCQQEG